MAWSIPAEVTLAQLLEKPCPGKAGPGQCDIRSQESGVATR
jgi:hypothetical protein